jgi:hypothetical protein
MTEFDPILLDDLVEVGVLGATTSLGASFMVKERSKCGGVTIIDSRLKGEIFLYCCFGKVCYPTFYDDVKL